MSKHLTKNARWIIALVETKTEYDWEHSSRVVCNLGRFSYDTPEGKALGEVMHWGKCKLIATYLVDVTVYPYAKDWKKVSKLAEKYFATLHQTQNSPTVIYNVAGNSEILGEI